MDQISEQCEMLVVANRLPVRRRSEEEGGGWATSPGGLVSALMPILRREGESGRSGGWIGWPGGNEYIETPFEHEGVLNIPVHLEDEQLAGYYNGMANQTLWPLYHDNVRAPTYRRRWWREYVAVNRIFADAAAESAAHEGFVWVHDYHLHLVPMMLRERRPDLRIGFFLHIPFPGRGLFAQLPWRTQIIRGTLGADVVGFQTRYGAKNFIELSRRYAGAVSITGGVRIDEREIVVNAFPISIDAAKFQAVAESPEVVKRAAGFRKRLDNRKVILGVDRMDYTKGIDIRLRAFQELLRHRNVGIDEAVFVQSAVPTRERVEDYAELRSRVEELVGQINGEFGEVGRVAVQYLHRNLPIEELVSMYLAADVLVVTPLRDGMNLVAKEYVASRHDERGVLVLSEFTGAAHELKKSIQINPHDLDGMVSALDQAIHMKPKEVTRRMRSLRQTVFRHDVYTWAESFMNRLKYEQPV